LGKKIFILLAGVAMNLIAAAVILTTLSFSGLPKLVDGQFAVASDTQVVQRDVVVTFVVEGSPADQAGIQASNEIISFNGQELSSSQDLAPLAQSLSGQTVEVVFEGENGLTSRDIRLNDEASEDGFLGVSTGDFVVERSTWSAPIRGTVLTGQFAWLTLEGLGSTLASLFSGQGSEAAANVAGPVGIVVLLNDVSQAGLNFVLMFVALISVTLAVMNALPIPALDGGRLFVTWLFRAIKRPLTAPLEEKIHATGMAVLMGLVILITVVDVRRFL
jgi:regulator of sigma E protease